jgi:hypothetical protein
MRILATHACLSGAAFIFAIISGYCFASGSSAAGCIWGALCLSMVIGVSIVIHDAIHSAAAAADEWRARWGLDVGSSPRLLRELLVSLEHGLHIRPCKGASPEERTEYVLLRLAEKRVHSERPIAELLH